MIASLWGYCSEQLSLKVVIKWLLNRSLNLLIHMRFISSQKPRRKKKKKATVHMDFFSPSLSSSSSSAFKPDCNQYCMRYTVFIAMSHITFSKRLTQIRSVQQVLIMLTNRWKLNQTNINEKLKMFSLDVFSVFLASLFDRKRVKNSIITIQLTQLKKKWALLILFIRATIAHKINIELFNLVFFLFRSMQIDEFIHSSVFISSNSFLLLFYYTCRACMHAIGIWTRAINISCFLALSIER